MVAKSKSNLLWNIPSEFLFLGLLTIIWYSLRFLGRHYFPLNLTTQIETPILAISQLFNTLILFFLFLIGKYWKGVTLGVYILFTAVMSPIGFHISRLPFEVNINTSFLVLRYSFWNYFALLILIYWIYEIFIKPETRDYYKTIFVSKQLWIAVYLGLLSFTVGWTTLEWACFSILSAYVAYILEQKGTPIRWPFFFLYLIQTVLFLPYYLSLAKT